MSVDTMQRVEDWLVTNVMTPNSYTYVMHSLNEDVEYESGPWILVIVSPKTTNRSGVEADEDNYMEEGVITFQVFDEKGSGTRDPYAIRDTLRLAMLQQKIYPGEGEAGTIHFYNLEQRNVVEVKRPSSHIDWIRLDLFVAYKKFFDV